MISPPHIIMIVLLEQGMPELIFYGSTSFADLLCFSVLRLLCLCSCLMVTCWETADLLALVWCIKL